MTHSDEEYCCDDKSTTACHGSPISSSASLSDPFMKPEINMSIDMLQMLDMLLHDDMRFKLQNYDFTKLMVLFRRSFPDTKNGDIINGGKVVETFTHTVWILHDEVTHDFCCPREAVHGGNGTCHFCGEHVPETYASICKSQEDDRKLPKSGF
jgi:hypothetical protein